MINNKEMMNLKTLRVFAVLVGLATVGWQIIQILNDNLSNMFFIADIVIGLLLASTAIIKHEPKSTLSMLIMFSATGGVFSVNTFGDLTLGQYGFGALTTTIGLIICLFCISILFKKLKND